jgi:DNA-binding NarL/FixJ family response regulator
MHTAQTTLTEREMETLRFICEGQSNAAIARNMGISTATVKKHVSACMDKTGMGSRTELIGYAVRKGLVSL